MITVFISALFQLHNSPPVYERTFLLSLCPALAASLTLTSVSLVSYAHLKNRAVIYSYFYLTVWIILFFSHFRSVPVKLETIIRCCKDYYSVTPPGSIDLKVTLARVGVLLVVYCLVLIASYLYAKHRRKGFSLTPFFILLIFLGLWVEMRHLVDLIRIRSSMQHLTGKSFRDNEWGFGQVAAVMTIVQILVIKFYFVKGVCARL